MWDLEQPAPREAPLGAPVCGGGGHGAVGQAVRQARGGVVVLPLLTVGAWAAGGFWPSAYGMGIIAAPFSWGRGGITCGHRSCLWGPCSRCDGCLGLGV